MSSDGLQFERAILRRATSLLSRIGRLLPQPGDGSQMAQNRRVDPIIENTRRANMARYQDDFKERVTALADQLASGEMPLRQWRARMAIEIRANQVTGEALGAGGFANLTADNINNIEQETKRQLDYLENWTAGLSNQTDISGGQVAARARMYAGASTSTFEQAVTQATIGLPELPFYPARGTECRTNCGCYWSISNLEGNGDFDCYWRLGKEDNCTTCLARLRACNPLKIRAGVVPDLSGADLFTGKALNDLLVLIDVNEESAGWQTYP